MGHHSKKRNHYRRLGYVPKGLEGTSWNDLSTCPVCSTLTREKMCARLFMHVSKHLRNYAYSLITEADDGILGIVVLTS